MTTGLTRVDRRGTLPPMRKPKPRAKTRRVAVRLGPAGRVVIPEKFRTELGLEPGDEMLIEADDRGLRIWSPDANWRAIQAIARRHVPEGTLVSEELIADRRREAERE